MLESNRNHCPDSGKLIALTEGRLSGKELDQLEVHLDGCAWCQEFLDQHSGLGELERSDIASVFDEDRGREIDRLRPILKDLSASGLTEPEADPVVPAMLGPYEIREVIAVGGMGIVFKALDPALQRTVAIKQLAPELAADERARSRFISEARAVAALDHENILPIFSVEADVVAPYIVMPFVVGESLQHRIETRGALGNDEIISIGSKIAAGLHFAHGQGIVHRDLKPGNILLSGDGRRVWIADFGLARLAGRPQVTRCGEIVGTPSFMAPEQIDGGEVDQRSDLFSLGATLYAMAVGTPPPFEADSIVLASPSDRPTTGAAGGGRERGSRSYARGDHPQTVAERSL